MEHNLISSKVFARKFRELLYRMDPMRLKPCPKGEYDPEQASITRRLINCGTVSRVQRIVHTEFCHWFSRESAGTLAHYQPLAEELLKLVQKYARPAKSDHSKPGKKKKTTAMETEKRKKR